MRLYRKGKPVDFGSSWFSTISEATEFEKPNEENIISIMWLKKQLFNKYFEHNGMGYRAKSPKNYALANPVIESMTMDKFEERLHHPIISKFYWDGEY